MGRVGKIVEVLVKIELVIFDEFGYLLFSVLGGVLLFYFFSKFYECISVVIIINLSFSEWVSVFGDVKMIIVFFDCFIYCCYILEIGNDSYCFKVSLEIVKKKRKEMLMLILL